MNNEATINYMVKYLEDKYGQEAPMAEWGIERAIESLSPYSWTLHTCDEGYRCKIHEPPECGEALLGDGVAGTIEESIRIALKMKSKKVCPNCGKVTMQLLVIRETKPDILRNLIHCNWCGYEREIQTNLA